jgi:hypothetical protein
MDPDQTNIFSTTHLDKIDGLYRTFSTHLVEWSQKHNVKLPSISSLRGQIVALMTHENHINMYFTRQGLDDFLQKFSMKSADVIQNINKTDQWGLGHQTVNRRFYRIPFPFEYISIHLKKRKKFSSQKTDQDKNVDIEKTKEYLKKYYIDVPDEMWDCGHKDPCIEDNTCNNLVFQPPLQRAYRNRFKFDEYGLRLCPTAEEIKNNVAKYFSKQEQIELKKFFSNTTL